MSVRAMVERLSTKPAPTMADVAKLAGVSAMTVSRALRQDAAVAAKTRARVMEVIDEIGYVPDQSAGSLSSGRSALVGVIMPTFTVPVFGMIGEGLAETLAPEGLQVFLAWSDYSSKRAERAIEAIMRRRPEAIAVAGADHTEKTRRMLAGSGVPVVEFFDEPSTPIDHVVAIDHVAIGRSIVRYLAKRGRRRLAIAGPREIFDLRGERRAAGVTAAAAELGLPPPIVVRHAGVMSQTEQGARGAAEVLTSGAKIDALICMNDLAAFGAMSECRRRGVKVPDDIAVTGFGDCELARYFEPTLTTIALNAPSIGVEIGKLILSALDSSHAGHAQSPFRLSVDYHLIERASA